MKFINHYYDFIFIIVKNFFLYAIIYIMLLYLPYYNNISNIYVMGNFLNNNKRI